MDCDNQNENILKNDIKQNNQDVNIDRLDNYLKNKIENSLQNKENIKEERNLDDVYEEKILNKNEFVISNNYLKFRFMTCEKRYYKLAKSYFKIIGIEVPENINKLSVLFEYLFLNQLFFFEIFEKKTENESLDLLSFLNINIVLNNKINELLVSMGCQEFINDVLNGIKFNEYINNKTYDVCKIKRVFINLFLKIISR
jgi:hypothetical protein